MKLRELPGALILGLLASLLAHTLGYGDAHVAGGVYHEDLLCLALAGGLGFVLFLALAAWLGARGTADGSALVSRLRPLLPRPATIAAAATSTFFAIEALEDHHAQAPALLLISALAVASFVVSRLGEFLLDAVACAVVALVASPFAPRRPVYLYRAAAASRISHARYGYRRFARPPPSFR